MSVEALHSSMLSCGKFDVVVIDPPWQYYGSQTKWAAAAKFYDTMSDDAVYGLPVRQMMETKSVVFVWATAPRLDAAMKAIEAWGLHYRGIAFVWVKTRNDGLPIGAQGIRASITKPTFELVLAASLVKTSRPLKIADESVASIVLAPRREHSRKPDEVQNRIERMYPSARKAEVFARTRREGWVAIGNDIEHFPSTQSQP
jgi:N6-adenosine-specific RNA methylase IME4